MDKSDRYQALHRLFLAHKRPIPLSAITEALECSDRQARRLIESMCLFFEAPIEYDPEANGWRYDTANLDRFELPGLWLTGPELQSLAFLLATLDQLGPGLATDELQVVRDQLNRQLLAHGLTTSQLQQRLRILSVGQHQITGRIFNRCAEALLCRKRLLLRYIGYGGNVSRREVSPQTLLLYRQNWYLDAWCHRRNALRTFAIARVDQAQMSDQEARDIPVEVLDEHFVAGYGIFSGSADRRAELLFAPAIAREIAQQQWHPEQVGYWEGDGYRLELPYSDERELVRDILRLVPYVKVLGPENLKAEIKRRLKEGLLQFE